MKRKALLMMLDAGIVNLAVLAALYLRFEWRVPPQLISAYFSLAIPYTLVCLGVFLLWGLYNILLKYASIEELFSIAGSTGVNAAALYGLAHVTGRILPRSIYVLSWIITFVLVGGLRISIRLYSYLEAGGPRRRLHGGGRTRVLIVGAGDAGAALAREIRGNPELRREIVGFIDDDPEKRGKILYGAKVLGDRHDIPVVVREKAVDEAIIAMPSVSPLTIREISEILRPLGIRVRIVPRISDLITGEGVFRQLREVRVEDILGRAPARIDLAKLSSRFKDKKVLVTGAGGSIGAELCRQALRFGASSVIMLGHGENSLFEAGMKLSFEFPRASLQTIVADVRDLRRMRQLLSATRPDVVFHAAACKHVPLMELSPSEAVKTNVFGTINVAIAAVESGVSQFVLISTDKAVRPRSVMGATKRAAELVVQCLNKSRERTGAPTRFVAVRFGNVLGSRGSLLRVVEEQIRRGGPVTVTHPSMTRYFMTIQEAVSLVMLASSLDEEGDLFVLDMGEPVRILELVEQMIRLSGYEPYSEIPIVFTGVRPGEKLHEELLTREELAATSTIESIYAVRESAPDVNSVVRRLRDLERAAFGDPSATVITKEFARLVANLSDLDDLDVDDAPSGADEELVVECLSKLVPSYRPCGEPDADTDLGE